MSETLLQTIEELIQQLPQTSLLKVLQCSNKNCESTLKYFMYMLLCSNTAVLIEY